MKHFKRENIYKASNVKFNCETQEAYSYDWWCFFKIINGKKVFNRYNYSPSTIKHQYKVRRLLEELGIKIDLEIECPKGLQSDLMMQSVVGHYNDEIKKLENEIAKPRSQAKKNEERKKQIESLKEKVKQFSEVVGV